MSAKKLILFLLNSLGNLEPPKFFCKVDLLFFSFFVIIIHLYIWRICLSFQPDGARINLSQVNNKNSDLIPTILGFSPWNKLALQTLCIYVKYRTLEEAETPVLGEGEKRERKTSWSKVYSSFLSR